MLVAVGILAAAGVSFSQNRSAKASKASAASAAQKTPTTTQKASKASKVGAAAVWGEKTSESDNALHFIVEKGDTIYVDQIQASKVYSRLPKQKGREWRKYYRLVHNFSKAYPYALVARNLVIRADSTLAADKLKGVKREKYIKGVQKEIFDVFSFHIPFIVEHLLPF